ncbi:uncharacterized protein TRUGW13939_11279 [Talaromyces rugulosus]|uniref:Triacylglycerol lipase n=1 Tax=Talaromyces rugulosus TaxID=121627 RepID=A0A7H8RCU8_TALRU|nr:uncharacterized protein TRUGW13939_11279 [Talaromyces rugulosus]QKX64106.1 hypothetical protein TRUGW13939_11279 [Talaromyces rugulosus]
MHSLLALLAGSSLFCSQALSASIDGLKSRSSPLPPSQDPWYTAPEQGILVSSPPGSILRIRPDPFDLYAAVGKNLSSASYNILYRTNDANEIPTFAVTTLFIPTGATSSGKDRHNLLSYQIPYNSPTVDASPSYALATDLSSTSSDIAAALEQGWYVSVVDHEGPKASFAVGVVEGHAVLDAVRAVTQSSSSPAIKNIGHGHKDYKWNVGLWGYSGGSIASEFAAELQATYAPDVEITAVAIGGLPTPVREVMKSVPNSPYAGLIPLALWGYANAFPELGDYLLSRLTPQAKKSGVFTKAHNMTVTEGFVFYNNSDPFSYFINGREDILLSPLINSLLERQGTMGKHGFPTMPMFVYKAIADQLAPIEGADALIEQYCGYNSVVGSAKGARILYERNTIGGHLAEELNQDASALAFLAKAFNGQLGDGWPHGNGTGCVVKNVAVGNDTSPDW